MAETMSFPHPTFQSQISGYGPLPRRKCNAMLTLGQAEQKWNAWTKKEKQHNPHFKPSGRKGLAPNEMTDATVNHLRSQIHSKLTANPVSQAVTMDNF